MPTDNVLQPARSFMFGPFQLFPERQLLMRGDTPVRIGSRALEILAVLVNRAGEIVEKRELLKRVWPTTFVEESNLKVNITALRRALGEQPASAKYVATVVGRGYRFVAPVQVVAAAPPVADEGALHNHNLPAAMTRIVGREDLIESIRLELQQARLLTIVGAGGIGKSTVALAVAALAVGRYRDGVWVVDLSATKDAALLPHAIAAAISMEANASDVLSALGDYLRQREMLILLESCEHMIEASAAAVDRLLSDASAVRILATSREPLQVKGERVRRLTGLTAPPDDAPLDAATALNFPAVQLFVERATDRLDNFSLGDADAPAAAAICRHLDGMPLAIELAATRIDTFGVAGLLDQLDDRLSLLTGWRTGPERHRTLVATLDWSYQLLAAPEAELLRALSVFAGAFDVPGTLAVGSGRPPETLNALAQLATKSLLAVDTTGDIVAYRLLDTTRAYAAELLAASGEEDAVRQRHAGYVADLLERAAAEWAGRAGGEWGATYGGAIDDLRSALAWTSHDPSRRALRIRLTIAGLLLWNHFSLTEEGRVHVERAVAELEPAGLTGGAAEMQLLMSLAGSTMFTRGLMPEVLADLRKALAIATELGDTDHRLRCLRMIADHQLFTGAHDTGLATLDEFVAVAATNDPSAQAGADTHLGLGEIYVGRLEAARLRLEKLYERDLGDLDDSRFARFLYSRNVDVGNGLANVQWLTGLPDTALRTATATVEQALKTRHELSLGNALAVTACRVTFMSGRYEDASRYTMQLQELVGRSSIVIWRPMALFFRGAIACTESAGLEPGIRDLRRAIDEFAAINHLARMPYHLAILAEALNRANQPDEALATIAAARERAIAQNERWCLPEVLRIEAAIHAAGGNAARAKASLATAMAVAMETGALSWQLRIAIDRTRLVGDAELKEIRSRFTEGFETQDLLAADEILRS